MRYVFADCTLDTERYELRRASVRIPLRPKVFQLLAYLITHRDRVVLKDELIAHLWPNLDITYPVGGKQQVSRLRIFCMGPEDVAGSRVERHDLALVLFPENGIEPWAIQGQMQIIGPV